MAKHKVKLHKWVNGLLEWSEHTFNSHREAHNFASKADCHTAKILSDDGSVVNEFSNAGTSVVETTQQPYS